MVRPVSATLIRDPGGSFICPNTRAVFSRTPDSFISVQRIVSLTGTFSHSSKDRISAVLCGNILDQLLDQHRLAYAGASEKTDLTPLA